MRFLTKEKKLIGSVLIAVVLLLVFGFDLFSYFEYKLQDIVYQKPGSPSPDIAVFGIDEKSFSKLGRFEDWNRQIMADAINILNSNEEYKPAVIAIDIFYVTEGSDKEADYNLARAAEAGGNVVLAANPVIGQDISLKSIVSEYEIPYPALAEHTAYGFASGIQDTDGLNRNAPLRMMYEGEIIYSFPVEVYKKYTGDEPPEFVNNNSDAYITYYGMPGDYYGLSGIGLSFSDIFEKDFEPDYFADCIVFIGPFATGMRDSYYTPISREDKMYGVEIHANVVQLLLEDNFKNYIPREVGILLIVGLILIIILAGKIFDIRILLAISLFVCVGWLGISLWLFGKGWIAPLLYPMLSVAVLYIYELIYGYVTEAMEKQKVKNAFKKYVDPRLVDKLMESGEANSNEIGIKKDIAVMFVDVRGFTPMAEALKEQPDLVVKILNEYLELTSSSVFNNGGSVDKFIGDATMALFNGFVPLEDYEFMAVKAAWEIVRGASSVNASVKEKYGVDVGFGVGVNCGEAIVGNLGPTFRKDYTAIGDTVNTASRLEANAKRSEILISGNLYNKIKDRIEAESIGEIPLKGKSEKLEVFSVKGILA